jgi:hypothetical protein
MKIYISHSREFDYENELYKPIRETEFFAENEIFFPHENQKKINTRKIISDSELIFAEISFASTGQGIEFGWADFLNKKIVCIHHKGTKISSSIEFLADEIFTYNQPYEVAIILEKVIRGGLNDKS